MSKTDRQTDKGTYWCITTFDEVEIATLKDISNYPYWIHTVFGGLEECPESKRIHFQGCIQCKTQQRFSAIKKWLPTTHIELARNPGALKEYALKDDTAIEEKVTRVNNRKFLSMADALTIVGEYNLEHTDIVQYVVEFNCKDTDDALKRMYWNAVRSHLETGSYDDISLFSQPQMIAAWKNTHMVWIRRAIVLRPATLEGLDIPTPQVPLENNM